LEFGVCGFGLGGWVAHLFLVGSICDLDRTTRRTSVVLRVAFWVRAPGFGGWGLGCRVWGLRFEVGGQGLVYRVVNVVWV